MYSQSVRGHHWYSMHAGVVEVAVVIREYDYNTIPNFCPATQPIKVA